MTLQAKVELQTVLNMTSIYAVSQTLTSIWFVRIFKINHFGYLLKYDDKMCHPKTTP